VTTSVILPAVMQGGYGTTSVTKCKAVVWHVDSMGSKEERCATLIERPRDRKGSNMTIKDIGPEPQSFNLEQETVANPNYRTVAWSGKYLQLTLMSIPEGGDIGLEAHPTTDQFLRLDAGRGRVQMGRDRGNLDFEQEVSDGWCIFVPAGTWHNVTNIGDEPMQLYAIYAPTHHQPGKVQVTAADAEADTDDEPPSWSVQPQSAPDLHA
jgi:mannose-6-phosphate isomerase-like protein (cupin superfamily)